MPSRSFTPPDVPAGQPARYRPATLAAAKVGSTATPGIRDAARILVAMPPSYVVMPAAGQTP
jgi:hypothetical protein